ncbi:MAG: efflux RND transporter permease subunit [Spirochaetes bacterium]|nr:MAG: efflux RND transporter permease subunit [Spirochaetota bacterium]
MLDTFIKRRVTTAMVFLGICLVGFIAVEKLPVQLLPDIEFPRLTIVTPYENASPTEVEQLVTRYIEEAASSVNGVLSVYSESLEGLSLVTVRFQWGTNMDMALIETKEKADIIKTQLPQDTGKSTVIKFDPKSDPVMIYTIALPSGTENDFAQLRRRIEKEIIPYLERIEGVALVDIMGGYRRQVNINLDCGKIYAHSLSLAEVIEGVNMANFSFPAGYVEKKDREYLVRTVGEFRNVAEMNKVVVGRNDAGVPIYLKEIGEIQDGFRDRKCIVRLNGKEAVGLLIRKEPGKNTMDVCSRVRERITELSAKYHKEFQLANVFDQSSFIQSSIDNVLNAAVMGGLISILVLWFFLKNVRYPLIISSSIPISILGTFALMYFKGISINTMSLGGLALGVGVMVDAGTVVLESIADELKRGKGKSRIANVIAGTREVFIPVTTSTLTTVIVFAPLVFITGLSGAVFSELALTITFSLLCSLLSSFLFIPMIVALDIPSPEIFRDSRITKTLSGIQQMVFDFSDVFMERAIALYTTIMEYTLANKKRVLVAGLVSMAFGAILFLFVDKELMPRVDPGELAIDIEMPKGTPLAESAEMSTRIESYLLKKPYVRDVYAKIGSDPDDNISEKSSGRASNNILIQIFLKGGRRPHVSKIVSALQNEIRVGEMVKMDYIVKESVVESLFGQGGKALTLEVYGKERDELMKIGERVHEGLAAIPEVRNISAALDRGHPELKVNIDRTAMASLGINISDIASGLRAAVRGEIATKYRESDDEIDVRVRLRREDRSEKDSLRRILVKSSTEANIPLGKIITIEEGSSPNKIIRSEQNRINRITADIVGSKAMVFGKVERMLSHLNLKEGYEVKFAGERDEISRSLGDIGFMLGFAIILVYMVLASQFQSLVSPFIIMLSIPVTILGVSASLLLTGTSLNINSGIGIVMLAGNVVANAIILFDFISKEHREGVGLHDAIIEAGKKRLEPILNTTLTTILALVPLAIGMGEGSELQRPMAIAVIGGLTVSTFLTMVVVPTIYAMVAGKSAR